MHLDAEYNEDGTVRHIAPIATVVPEQVRTLRVGELLEQIGTAEARQVIDKARRDGQSDVSDEQRAQHAAQHAERAGGEAEHARGGEHHVISDADQCVDAADRHSGQDDRLNHRITRCSREPG